MIKIVCVSHIRLLKDFCHDFRVIVFLMYCLWYSPLGFWWDHSLSTTNKYMHTFTYKFWALLKLKLWTIWNHRVANFLLKTWKLSNFLRDFALNVYVFDQLHNSQPPLCPNYAPSSNRPLVQNIFITIGGTCNNIPALQPTQQ